MRVTIVGSGTLLPDDDRRSAAHLVEGRGFTLLLDCGSGTVHGLARDGLPWQGITHLALSHYHTDHTGDLAAILWAMHHGVPGGRRTPLVVLGPRGLRRLLEGLALAHGEWLREPGFELRAVELPPSGRYTDPEAGFTLSAHPVPHTPDSVAWRLDTEEGTLGYTGDTGPHPPLGGFFSGVDLLVAECALPDEAAPENHLTPSSVAAIAGEAGPGLLVLTHLYPELDLVRLPDLVRAAGYTGKVLVGWDGLRIDLDPGGASAPDPGVPAGPSILE